MDGNVVSEEVRRLLIASTHRYRKVREVALKHLDAILTSFAALMCDRQIVFVLLEILTLLRRSCEDVFTDEVSISDAYCTPNGLVSLHAADAIQTLHTVLPCISLSFRQDGSLSGNHGRLRCPQ